MRALILAGGRGTRLRPLTHTRPKPLMPFMGEPYLVGLLRRLAQAHVDRATVLTGPQPEAFAAIPDAGARLGIDMDLVAEPHPLDTAGAARRLLHGSAEAGVLICNGDLLTDVDYGALHRSHLTTGATATLAVKRVEDVSSYGVLVLDDDGRVLDFLEKPDPGTTDRDTVNAGAYVLDAAAFDSFPEDGPLSFEYDVFPHLVREGRRVQGVELPATWQDLGTPERLLLGHRLVLEGQCAWPWPPGMQRHQPLVAVHEGADVAPDADLTGPVVVGAGCCVGSTARITDSVLFEDARIGERTTIASSIVGQGAHVMAGASIVGDVVADGETVD